MKLLAIYCENLHWSVHKNDPAKYALQSIPNCDLLNPLIYSEIDRSNIANKVNSFFMNAEQAITSCSELVLLVPDDFAFDETNKYDDFLKRVRRLLSNIRYYSKQHTINSGSDNLSFGFQEVSKIPNLPTFKKTVPSIINSSVVDFAISWDNLISADTTSEDFTVPVFDTIVLDAISAFYGGDYRKAILYSAMAIEAVANIKLEEAYEVAIQDSPSDLRIVSFNQAGGEIVKKDPIYESLSETTNFSRMLHERPLYLLKRSLLVDNDVVYKAAIKLYRTRNKIVHHGEPPVDENERYLVLERSSALEAIKCSVDIFKWFGVNETYFNPTGGYYQIHIAILNQLCHIPLMCDNTQYSEFF